MSPQDRPIHVQRKHVEVAGARIYYQETGAGPPLVLLHGLSASTRWWSGNMATFAERFQVFAIDLVGFGRSQGTTPFVLDDAVYVLVNWMDRLGIDRVRIAGHSMGGYIASRLAVDFPDRVDELLLVDAAVFPEDYSFLRASRGLIRSIRYTPLRFLPLLFTDALAAGPITIWKAARQIFAADIAVAVERIAAPALLVWGENDVVVPVEIGRDLAKRIPGARFVVIPDAGHNPMWDRPAVFNDEVLRFLSGDR